MPVPDHPVPRPARRLLRDVTYDHLLGAILDGDLVPGERLSDDELAGWLQVSKTPVKEAVARLADQGLVEIRANRYTRVAEVSPDDLVDVLELLGALLATSLRDLPAGSTDAAAVADRVVERARRGSCLDVVLEAQAFAPLSTNHLVAGSAEPLVHRLRFSSRHLRLDLDDRRVAPALREALDALAGRRWADAADAFGVAFSRSALRDVVAPLP
ncbi:GntR family transcriptional regulator [Frigoribacterium salinisoli]